MPHSMERYETQVRATFAAPGQVNLAVPQIPQPLSEIMANYPGQWAMAALGPYFEPSTGLAYGPVWAWGRPLSRAPSHWPTLVWHSGGYRIDPQGSAGYDGTFMALGAGPLLVQDGRPVDMAAALERGGFTGIPADERTPQAALGLRPDGLLAYVTAAALTLRQLALVMAELGCAAALRLNSGGPAYLRGGPGGPPRLLEGEDRGRYPCALVLVAEAAIPVDIRHWFAPAAESGGTPILGRAIATAGQMESFCHQVNPDAPGLAARYLAIGEVLGVRGDLAYAQALHETGFFRYGGAVQPAQYNFAGLGSTGPGVPGAAFASPEEGIMAQIQHLYAYATARPLPPGMVVVDPRFALVPRGAAPRSHDLNGRWAVPGTDYGQSLDRLLAGILAADPAAWSRARGWTTRSGWFMQRLLCGWVGRSDAPRSEASRAVLTVVSAATPVRAEPGGETLLSLPTGQRYPALERKGEHWRITLPDGSHGWVHGRDVAVTPAAAPGPGDPGSAVIIIDPGHGGADAGAHQAGWLPEKELNLRLAKLLIASLRARGVGVRGQIVLSRAGDADTSLAYRSDLANASGAHLFLSIHHNAAGSSAARGTETFYQCGAEQDAATRGASQRLACLVHSGVLAAITAYNQNRCPGCCPPHDRGVIGRLLSAGDPRSYYFVLRNTFVPAVLAEIAFLTNAAEAACASQPDFQRGVADRLAQGIEHYLQGRAEDSCRLPVP